MYEDKAMFGVQLVGKAKGIYVAIGSEDGIDNISHMMAMTASFYDEKKLDSLKFFGVHRRDVMECHVAVIGGTGKFEDANGYAIIRSLVTSSNNKEVSYVEEVNKFLLFNVYLS